MKSTLEAAQARDQAGFRHDFSCDDHLFVVSQIIEKSNEIGKPCWMATLDFKKAFDTITHEALWKALEKQSIPASYIGVLKALYSNQTARVQTDTSSRTFAIHRGTKQGDPISSALFNAVVEEMMKNIKRKWKLKGWGLQLELTTEEKLTNLRFADDILLIARTLPQLKSMLQDVADAASEVGLELHPDKTNILHNGIGYGVGATTAKLRNMKIEILDHRKSATYLGRTLKPTDMQEEELKNRLSRAWAKFNNHKEILVNDRLPIGLRLKLFSATVTPTLLYGSGTWALTQQMCGKLRAQQRKMLRCIAKCHKHFPKDPHTVDEYVNWIKHATTKTNQLMDQFDVRDWVDEQRCRKWTWAGTVARRQDSRWTHEVLKWDPPDLKIRGRPKTRWSDEINEYLTAVNGCQQAGKDWTMAALDKKKWSTLLKGFVEYSKAKPRS